MQVRPDFVAKALLATVAMAAATADADVGDYCEPIDVAVGFPPHCSSSTDNGVSV